MRRSYAPTACGLRDIFEREAYSQPKLFLSIINCPR
jgi:hypothetical protein